MNYFSSRWSQSLHRNTLKVASWSRIARPPRRKTLPPPPPLLMVFLFGLPSFLQTQRSVITSEQFSFCFLRPEDISPKNVKISFTVPIVSASVQRSRGAKRLNQSQKPHGAFSSRRRSLSSVLGGPWRRALYTCCSLNVGPWRVFKTGEPDLVDVRWFHRVNQRVWRNMSTSSTLTD